jgi:Phosphomannose isomerase
MNKTSVIRDTFEKGEGVLRLIPVFVPRRFSKAGRRLRLHPDDYYALGTKRGSIKERWFSSVISAINGEMAPEDEGMSYVAVTDDISDKVLFKDFVDELGAEIIGEELKNKYGTWPMYSKFFDYEESLFHHLHLDFISAGRVGRLGKPEAYYYPPQMNNYTGSFPHTYFGFDTSVTKEQVRERLLDYEKRDIRITELSRAYRIELGTGWYTPPGVVHAPGSYLTYEPQWNSDVNSVYENVTAGEVYPYDFLVENCPDDKKYDIDYVISLMDWEKNTDPDYRSNYFRPPVKCKDMDERYIEKWVSYANDYIGAKELTVLPGRTAVVKDGAAYGCIIIQGHDKFGIYDAEAAIMLRFGQMSADEYFVSEHAAKKGIAIVNESKWEPLVMLKHFGPNHPDMP